MQDKYIAKVYDFESLRERQDVVRHARKLEKENEMLTSFVQESTRELDKLRCRLETET